MKWPRVSVWWFLRLTNASKHAAHTPVQVVIVGEAGDGAEGIEVVCRSRPEVVVMDIRMPRLNGVDATRRLMSLQAR